MQFLTERIFIRKLSKWLIFMGICMCICMPVGKSTRIYGQTTNLSAQTRAQRIYSDAIYFHEQVSKDMENHFCMKDGYIFWSTKEEAKVKAQEAKPPVWTVVFQVDGSRVAVNLTEAEYQMIQTTQKQIQEQAYGYTLYAIACDFLQELAVNKNKSQAQKIFDSPEFYLTIAQDEPLFVKKIDNAAIQIQYHFEYQTKNVKDFTKKEQSDLDSGVNVSIREWQTTQILDCKNLVYREGYTFQNRLRCGNNAVYLTCGDICHTSYLRQFMEEKEDILLLNDASDLCWKKNTYQLQYYTKKSPNASTYTRIGTQNAEYGETYALYATEQLSFCVPNGVKLKGWAEKDKKEIIDTEQLLLPQSNFSDSINEKIKEEDGCIIRLYAVWEIETYEMISRGNMPSNNGDGQNHSQAIAYEIYGIGFTRDKEFAYTIWSKDPFYWESDDRLLQAEQLQAEQLQINRPSVNGYIWQGLMDTEGRNMCFDKAGKALFDSPNYFSADTIMDNCWIYETKLVLKYHTDMNAQENKMQEECFLYGDLVQIKSIPKEVYKDGYVYTPNWHVYNTLYNIPADCVMKAEDLAAFVGKDLQKESVEMDLEIEWQNISYFVDYYVMDTQSGVYKFMASQQCMYGSVYEYYTQEMCGCLEYPQGQVVLGWSETAEDTGKLYKCKQEFSNLTTKNLAHINRYLVRSNKQYEVKLDENCPWDCTYLPVSGTKSIMIDSVEKRVLGQVVLPSLEGYVFDGYYTQQTQGSKMIDANGKIEPALVEMNKDCVLYARWKKLSYYINFHANTGSFSDTAETVWKETITYGAYLPIAKMPFKKGYSFKGYSTYPKEEPKEFWYDSLLCTHNRKFDLREDVHLYANWEDDICPKAEIRTDIFTSKQMWTNQSVLVHIDATDAGSGIVKLELYQRRLGEKDFQLLQHWEQSPTQNMKKTVWIETSGITRLYCVAWDAAGNSSMLKMLSGETLTTIYIDKQPPYVTVPQLSDFYFKVEASDDERVS